MYPFNPNKAQTVRGAGGNTDRDFIAHQTWADPGVADPDAILDGATPGTVTALVSTTFLAQPDYARALSVIGNNASVAGTVAVVGTNIAGESISENIVLDGTVSAVGNAAFKTVSQITTSAQSDAAYTVDVGTTEKLGLLHTLPHDTVLAAYLDNTREGTLPTVATNATSVHLNTVDLSSALDGDAVDVYYIV